MAPWFRRWQSRLVWALAVGYPVALVVVLLLLRFVGERWWVTGFALYLPPLGFAAPLPLVALLLVVVRRWQLLRLQLVSLFLILFPLLGLTLSLPSWGADARPTLRVLSYNVNSCYGECKNIAAEILPYAADLVFVQELASDERAAELEAALKPRYPHVSHDVQFLIASKFPLKLVENPERLAYEGNRRSPRFMKYVIETSIGPITFFNLHTVSPRGDFYSLRGAQGFRREITSGRLLTRVSAEQEMLGTSGLRVLQVETVAEQALREPGAVVIVGDTNLPRLSPARARYLSDFQDGFSKVGLGFGNTFPEKWPWMRIDLVLASQQLRFKTFVVGKGQASDHRCIVAELQAR